MPAPPPATKTWFNMADAAGGAECAEVSIYDDIGAWGITAKDFIGQLSAIKAKKINLRINSGGGDFFDACAIYNAIKEHAAETTCHVMALAASAASVIAIAGKKVVMSKNSFMMIHNVMSFAFGDAADMRKQADTLDKLTGSLADMYAGKTGKPAADMAKAMNDETWYGATEAKAAGLADEIVDPDEAEEEEGQVNSVVKAVSKYKRAPEGLRRYAASLSAPRTQENSMLPIYNKGGKSFVIIDGKEHEIETPAATAQIAAVATLQKVDPVDAEKVKTEAVKNYKQYLADCNTALAAAGIKGEEATKFMAEFEGRPIADIKFLASHNIAARAKAVGEGAGDNAETPEQKAEKVEKEFEAGLTKRWTNDANLRRMHGVRTADPKDPLYVARLARYVAAEKKCRDDQASGKVSEMDQEPSGADPITQLLKNSSVVSAA